MTRMLLAGASGHLGRLVLAEAKAQGHWVRSLSRTPPQVPVPADDVLLADATLASALTGCCEGTDVLVSCLGASVGMQASEKRSYQAVDLVAHQHLLHEAQRAGVRRVVYVSLWLEPAYLNNGYVAAHEAVVKLLQASGLSLTVMRPTGFFSAMQEFFELARKGLAPLTAGGKSRSNPIHQADLATELLRYLETGPAEVGVGGPDILSRRQIFELAFAALGKKPRFLPMPGPIMHGLASLSGRFDPRLGELMRFATQVSSSDCVAPQLGTQRLQDYFAALAKTERA